MCLQPDAGGYDSGHVELKKDDEQDLEQALATIGPIAGAIDAAHLSFQLYKSGVQRAGLNHGIAIVGYDTDPSDYYIVKNSYGPSWGIYDYVWMPRGRENQCGIASMGCYPLL